MPTFVIPKALVDEKNKLIDSQFEEHENIPLKDRIGRYRLDPKNYFEEIKQFK